MSWVRVSLGWVRIVDRAASIPPAFWGPAPASSLPVPVASSPPASSSGPAADLSGELSVSVRAVSAAQPRSEAVVGEVREVEWAHVEQLRARVATRLAAMAGDDFRRLEEDSREELLRTLVIEEVQQWVMHRSYVGASLLSEADEDALIEATLRAATGMGRLDPILRRTDVEDIFYNGAAPTMLRLADGRKVPGPALGRTNAEVAATIRQAISAAGGAAARELTMAAPLLSVRLKAVGDLGARMSAAIDVTPAPAGTIRIHRHADVDLQQLRAMGMINAPLVVFLQALVRAQAKIAVVGGTGMGKTTLLRALCAEIPTDHMIVTIEDDRELGLHVLAAKDATGRVLREPSGQVVLRRPAALVRAYEARPANSEGAGAVSMEDLGRQALRDSPDALIFGEVRGGEIVPLLEGVTNGVGGVMFTLHADSATATFDRVVQLVRKAQPPLPADFALSACTHVDVVVHVRRDRRHRRFVSEVIEVREAPLAENGYPRFERIFAPGPDGRAVPTGRHLSGGLRERVEDAGFDVGWLRAETADWPPWPEYAGLNGGAGTGGTW